MGDENTAASRVEARFAITDLVHGYALHVRRGEAGPVAALFAEEGRFEVRTADPRDPQAFAVMSRAEGRAAVEALVTEATARARLLPMIHDLVIVLDEDGVGASASSLMVVREWPGGQELIGEYADRFCRQGPHWRFAERIYTVFTLPIAGAG